MAGGVSATLQPLDALTAAQVRGLRGVFCDIDDTLTVDGEIVPAAFLALHQLRDAGLHVVRGWQHHIPQR